MRRARFALAAAAAAVVLSGCGAAVQPRTDVSRLPVPAAAAPDAAEPLRLVGRWERVRNHRDGRYLGASARSYHGGDAIAMLLTGRQFRIYGVAGPTGGRATVLIGADQRAVVDFYAPRKTAHAVVYLSPPLDEGTHSVVLVVDGEHQGHSRGNYVNVEEVEVLHG